MRGLALGLAVLFSATPALGQATCSLGLYPGRTTCPPDMDALAAAIPTSATTVPPAPTPTGAAGTAGTYIPANAIAPSLTRSTRATTASDGTFAVTWSTPLISTTPVGFAVPIGSSTAGPTDCTPTAITQTGMTGKCWTESAMTIGVLGASINPFTSAAAGISISVFAREPTQ